jgi:hypothetical protein
MKKRRCPLYLGLFATDPAAARDTLNHELKNALSKEPDLIPLQ